MNLQLDTKNKTITITEWSCMSGWVKNLGTR